MATGLMTGVPIVESVYTGTGVVAGSRLYSPLSKIERFVQISLQFSANPGAYVFSVQGAASDAFFAEIAQITGNNDTNKIVKVPAYQILRIAQLSKTNNVTATVTTVLM